MYAGGQQVPLLHLVIQGPKLIISLPSSTCLHEMDKSTEQDLASFIGKL